MQLRFLMGALAAFFSVFAISVVVKIGFFDSLDYALVLTINGLASMPFASVVLWYTEVSGEIIWIVLIPILYIFMGKYGRRSAVTMASAILLGVLVEMMIGQIYYRPRPYYVLDGLNLFSTLSQDSSFPSGHTTRAFAGALALSCNYRRWSYVMLPFAVAAGISRVYLGVHYPSDILGGALTGLGAFLTITLIVNRFWHTTKEFKPSQPLGKGEKLIQTKKKNPALE